jgi:prephenate dehydrogenase
MKIGVIGLGLIGGSLAKAIKKNTTHTVFGKDINEETMKKAILTGAIDGELTDISLVDILIVSLYPSATVKFIEENAEKLKKGAIVTDVSGVKKSVCDKLFPLAEEKGFSFIGGHPMAGVEFSGFDYSKDALFKNASMILVPSKKESIGSCELLSELFKSLGFTRIQFTTPEEHDKMIALTSQLAHVISSAYVKSPSALNHKGFSAGSFRDMTRVARLSPEMWSQLTIDNSDFLVKEIDSIVNSLTEYKTALLNKDKETMHALLADGNEKKLLSEKMRRNKNND